MNANDGASQGDSRDGVNSQFPHCSQSTYDHDHALALCRALGSEAATNHPVR